MVPQSHYFAPDDWPPALRTRYGSPVQGASRPSGSEILVYKIVAMKPMNSPANSIVRTSESPTHRRTRTRIVLSGSRRTATLSSGLPEREVLPHDATFSDSNVVRLASLISAVHARLYPHRESEAALLGRAAADELQ